MQNEQLLQFQDGKDLTLPTKPGVPDANGGNGSSPNTSTKTTQTTSTKPNIKSTPSQQQPPPRVKSQREKVEERRARNPMAGVRQYNPDPNGLD